MGDLSTWFCGEVPVGRSSSFRPSGELPVRVSRPENLMEKRTDTSSHKNWMEEFLTPEVNEKLKDRRTANGFTLHQCIQRGVANPTHPFIKTVGLVAGDEESYFVFSELFNPVISARHSGHDLKKFVATDLNPKNLSDGEQLDPRYVLSCRIRGSRNIKGFCLTSWYNREERLEVERIAINALETFSGSLKGLYYPVSSMSENEKVQLAADHIFFDKPVSSIYLSTNMVQDWPHSRGIWYNAPKNFVVWVNEEDHMRVISVQRGGNMKEVFERFCEGLKKIEEALKSKDHSFMFDSHLGFISTCPCNLGTGLRASVHLKVPFLSQHSCFNIILEKLKLQKRGPNGADSAPDGDIIDISNANRLGSTEVEQVLSVISGVKLLIEMEKRLEANTDITDLMPIGK